MANKTYLEVYFINDCKNWHKGMERIYITPLFEISRDYNKAHKFIVIYLFWIFFGIEISIRYGKS